MKQITRYQNFLTEEVTGNRKIDQALNVGDQGMVYGVIDLLKKVKDKKNREEIAIHLVDKFKKEGITFPYEEFFAMCGLSLNNQIKDL